MMVARVCVRLARTAMIGGKIAVNPGTEPGHVQRGGFAITFYVPPGQHVIDVVTHRVAGRSDAGAPEQGTRDKRPFEVARRRARNVGRPRL